LTRTIGFPQQASAPISASKKPNLVTTYIANVNFLHWSQNHANLYNRFPLKNTPQIVVGPAGFEPATFPRNSAWLFLRVSLWPLQNFFIPHSGPQTRFCTCSGARRHAFLDYGPFLLEDFALEFVW